MMPKLLAFKSVMEEAKGYKNKIKTVIKFLTWLDFRHCSKRKKIFDRSNAYLCHNVA